MHIVVLNQTTKLPLVCDTRKYVVGLTTKWVPLLLIIFKLLCVFISPNGRTGDINKLHFLFL
jgi:hypothetical protein